MLGNLLSKAVKVATLPIDVGNAGLDILTGGDGSKESRKDAELLGLEELRDNLTDLLEDLDN